MKIFNDIGKLAGNVVREVKEEAGEAGHAAAGALDTVKDDLFDVGGAAIGYAELAGLKYPVKGYEAPVSSQLSRGSRLSSDADYASLKARGFKGIVNLCAENDSDTAPAAKNGLASLHLKIIDNTPPTEGQMKQFLDFVKANQPAYVHCEAGQGRTGVAVACYRMAFQHYTPQQALAEAKQYGMQMPDQEQFILKFGADLAAGRIAGYPVP